MYLQRLKLVNFRNYQELELELSKNVNVFFGNNAHGKTNIIESIYISSITKSYRTNKDIECIYFEKEFFRNSHLYIGDNDNKIDVIIENIVIVNIYLFTLFLGKYGFLFVCKTL